MKRFHPIFTLLPHIKLIIKVIERSTATSAIITRQGKPQTDIWGSLLLINEIAYKSVITANIKGYIYSPFIILSNRSEKHVHTQQSHSTSNLSQHTTPLRCVPTNTVQPCSFFVEFSCIIDSVGNHWIFPPTYLHARYRHMYLRNNTALAL